MSWKFSEGANLILIIFITLESGINVGVLLSIFGLKNDHIAFCNNKLKFWYENFIPGYFYSRPGDDQADEFEYHCDI